MATLDSDVTMIPAGEASSSAAPSSSTKKPKRFEIKKWSAVSLWAWGNLEQILDTYLEFILRCLCYHVSFCLILVRVKTFDWLIFFWLQISLLTTVRSAEITSWIFVSPWNNYWFEEFVTMMLIIQRLLDSWLFKAYVVIVFCFVVRHWVSG